MVIETLNRAGRQFQARLAGYADSAFKKARGSAKKAADRVATAHAPVEALAEATQRLNDLSHRHVEQFVRQQVHMLEGVITDSAKRLERAAKAEGFKALLADQAQLLSASRERLARDLKATWAIATSTGREIGEVAVETYAQLIQGAKSQRKPTAKRAPARPRKTKRARKT